MKYKINKGGFVREINEVEIEVPEQPMYIWHNGIRRHYSVTPEWTTWNIEHYKKPEEIWQFKIVIIDPQDKLIEAVIIRVSDIESILNRDENPYNRLVDSILNYDEFERRTKEQFMADFNTTLDNINKNLPL